MDIILLEKVRNLGGLGEQVSVKPGYGRNFLIPSGKAVMATKANIEKFEARRAELEKKAADQLAASKAMADKIASVGSVTIATRAGDEGKLFGSVTAQDVVDAIATADITVSKRDVQLPDAQPIRSVGEYEVTLMLHTDVSQTLKVIVVPE